MRPIIIEVDKKKILNLTIEDLKKMLDDAYDQGYRDGYNSHWYAYPYVTTTTPYYYTTGGDKTGDFKKWWNDITCSTSTPTVDASEIAKGTTTYSNMFSGDTITVKANVNTDDTVYVG